jgi:hypothetical protein
MGEIETTRKLLKALAEQGDADTIEGAVRAILRGKEAEPEAFTIAEQAKRLRTAQQAFATKHEFKAGDLVQWKPGMKNRKRPRYGQPIIVVAVLKEPALDTNPEESSASTPYFREPLDVALGLVDSDGDFLVFHFDSRRFEPFGGEGPK